VCHPQDEVEEDDGEPLSVTAGLTDPDSESSDLELTDADFAEAAREVGFVFASLLLVE
jgi:hypothetical protein